MKEYNCTVISISFLALGEPWEKNVVLMQRNSASHFHLGARWYSYILEENNKDQSAKIEICSFSFVFFKGLSQFKKLRGFESNHFLQFVLTKA